MNLRGLARSRIVRVAPGVDAPRRGQNPSSKPDGCVCANVERYGLATPIEPNHLPPDTPLEQVGCRGIEAGDHEAELRSTRVVMPVNGVVPGERARKTRSASVGKNETERWPFAEGVYPNARR